MRKQLIVLTVFFLMLSVSLAEAQIWLGTASGTTNSRYNRRTPASNTANNSSTAKNGALNSNSSTANSRSNGNKLATIAPEPEESTGNTTGNPTKKTESANTSAVKSHPALSKTPVPADLATTELTHPRNHVLLIGVNDYPDAPPSTPTRLSIDLSDLNFCVKDMRGMQEALVKARFCRAEDIQILVSGAGGENEPTADNVFRALEILEEKIQRDDRVLIAFSGHGVSLPIERSTETEDYLCCANADVLYDADRGQFVRKDGIISRASDIEEFLDRTEAGTKLVFIDACRNALSEMTGIVKSGETGSRGVANVRSAVGSFGKGVSGDVSRRGLFRFSSCIPGEISQEYTGDLHHGIFTYFIIQGMLGAAHQREPGKITLDDLRIYVARETRNFVEKNISTEENPVYQSPVLIPIPEGAGYPEDVLFSYCNYVEETPEEETVPTPEPMPTPMAPVPDDTEQQRQNMLVQQENERRDQLAREERQRQEEESRRLAAEQAKLREEWAGLTDQFSGLNSFENRTQARTSFQSATLQREWSNLVRDIDRFNEEPQGPLTRDQIDQRESWGERLERQISSWESRATAQQQVSRPNNSSNRSSSGGRSSGGGGRMPGIR